MQKKKLGNILNPHLNYVSMSKYKRTCMVEDHDDHSLIVKKQ